MLARMVMPGFAGVVTARCKGFWLAAEGLHPRWPGEYFGNKETPPALPRTAGGWQGSSCFSL